MKFVVGENGRNSEKNLPRPRFVHHKTHMEGPRRELGTPAVGGEPNHLRHEAAIIYKIQNNFGVTTSLTMENNLIITSIFLIFYKIHYFCTGWDISFR